MRSRVRHQRSGRRYGAALAGGFLLAAGAHAENRKNQNKSSLRSNSHGLAFLIPGNFILRFPLAAFNLHALESNEKLFRNL
jgi:hypothetical protein